MRCNNKENFKPIDWDYCPKCGRRINISEFSEKGMQEFYIVTAMDENGRFYADCVMKAKNLEDVIEKISHTFRGKMEYRVYGGRTNDLLLYTHQKED